MILHCFSQIKVNEFKYHQVQATMKKQQQNNRQITETTFKTCLTNYDFIR